MKNKQTYEIVLTGLGMALVFVATMFIKVPNALDGYFNLGDGFILLFAVVRQLQNRKYSKCRLCSVFFMSNYLFILLYGCCTAL